MNKKHEASFERPELAKAMGVFDFFSLGFGAMVGVGWVIAVGGWITTGGGPLGAAIAFALGALILLPVSYAFGELTSAMPVAGGEFAHTYRAFGSSVSYFTGWMLCFGYAFLCPWEIIAVGGLSARLFPALKSVPLYEFMGFTVYLPTLILDLLVAVAIIRLNLVGTEKVASFQTIMTKFLLVCTGIYLLTSMVKGEWSNSLPLLKTSGGLFGSLGGIVAVLAITPFFYAGFDAIAQGAEEGKSGLSYRKLGKTLSISILAGGVFYVLAIMAVSLLMPWEGLSFMEMPAADAILALSPAVGRIVILGAICGLLTTLNAFFVSSTRVLFGMGRSRLLPEWFANTNRRHNTPANAIKFIGVLCLAAPFIGNVLLVPIVDVGSLCFIAAWLVVSAACLKLRYSEPDLVRPFHMPGGTKTGWLAVLISVAMVLVMVLPSSPGTLVWPLEWLVLLAWVILGAGFYMLSAKNRRAVSEKERMMLIFGKNYSDV